MAQLPLARRWGWEHKDESHAGRSGRRGAAGCVHASSAGWFREVGRGRGVLRAQTRGWARGGKRRPPAGLGSQSERPGAGSRARASRRAAEVLAGPGGAALGGRRPGVSSGREDGARVPGWVARSAKHRRRRLSLRLTEDRLRLGPGFRLGRGPSAGARRAAPRRCVPPARSSCRRSFKFVLPGPERHLSPRRGVARWGWGARSRWVAQFSQKSKKNEY